MQNWQPTATHEARVARAEILRTIREFFHRKNVLAFFVQKTLAFTDDFEFPMLRSSEYYFLRCFQHDDALRLELLGRLVRLVRLGIDNSYKK